MAKADYKLGQSLLLNTHGGLADAQQRTLCGSRLCEEHQVERSRHVHMRKKIMSKKILVH